jgi:dimethylamine/trimethylamine dehydrogenase
MTRDPRHDILFEPLRIGPRLARNRFYQVPHCNGLGHRSPRALARMRATKAEGGWAVVCTEAVEIHPASEVSPSIEGRLWSDADIPAHARVAEEIAAHGALSGIELVFPSPRANHVSRLVPMGVRAGPVHTDALDPVQARAMAGEDIRQLRRWHRQAVGRAIRAGYDLVYVYAGHGLALPLQFLSRAHNDRSDAYGGPLANRARLLRELIEDTLETAAGRVAVAVRLALAEPGLDRGLTPDEVAEVVGMLAELPDLWDFCMGRWAADSPTARHAAEGFQQDAIAGLKRLTSKPVVGVGRFTSPDTMVAQIRGGFMDFIGAARPSIADPFLPRKIETGESGRIRECIGCNICVASDNQQAPIRCTQNPTMGEEWRRGWHPERIEPRASEARVLVVGGGPAGLEAARALGARGYAVALAEAAARPGGRVLREARLPGLATWARVADWRLGEIARMPNVELYPASVMTAADVLAFGAAHAVIATGARWRGDGRGRQHPFGLAIDPAAAVLTPDDILDGARPAGRVAIYDDDHYVMGSALAELLAAGGAAVTLITPAPLVAAWTVHTLEQAATERRLVARGVAIRTRAAVVRVAAGGLLLADLLTGRPAEVPCDTVVLVTSRAPQDGLVHELAARRDDWAAHGLRAVTAIGDALAPATIAAAVHAGHRFARDFDRPADPDAVPFCCEPA